MCGWILIRGVDGPRILLYSRSLFIVSQNFLGEDFIFDLQIFNVACMFLIDYTRKESQINHSFHESCKLLLELFIVLPSL